MPGLHPRRRLRRTAVLSSYSEGPWPETQFFQGFSSSFNSLQVKFDRRFTSGLILTTAFTWQKAMDYQSGRRRRPGPLVYRCPPQLRASHFDLGR